MSARRDEVRVAGMPLVGICHTVEGATWGLGPASSPWMRR